MSVAGVTVATSLKAEPQAVEVEERAWQRSEAGAAAATVVGVLVPEAMGLMILTKASEVLEVEVMVLVVPKADQEVSETD